MKLVLGIFFSCLCAVALSQVWCPNPPGGLVIPTSDCCGGEKMGLGLFMKTYFELMQLDCMLDIFFDALMFDDEVLDFYSYVSGPEFEQLCVYIQNMPEWMELTEYFCFELDFDPYKYLNTMGTVLNIVHMAHPEGCTFEFPLPWGANSTGPTISKSSAAIDRPARWPVTPENGIGGMVGLIDVLYYEIPHDQGYDLWLHHIETDEYLCRAVEKMRTPYFKYMVMRIEQHPEYIRFYTKMNQYGVNFTAFTEYLKKFLWESDYCL